MMYISSSYSSPPFDKKANKQKHQKKKNPGQWHSLGRVESRPVYRTCQVMDSPTGQGDTIITRGSVTVPLGGKRARSVMYLTVNI